MSIPMEPPLAATPEEPPVSYATQRKIRIIESKLGPNWHQAEANQGKSIDAIYNRVIGDDRRNLFCKISGESKRRIDEMVVYYDMKLAEFIEGVIDYEYNLYQDRKAKQAHDVARDFSGGA